jgi:hypothetical protein
MMRYPVDMLRYYLMIPLMTGCASETVAEEEASSSFIAMTYNAGTTTGLNHDADDNGYSSEMAEAADELYENSLSWQPAEEALRAHLEAVSPDLAVFQELFYDPWCEDIIIDPELDFVCEGYTPDRPLQIERLLGEGYQIACAPGQPDNCAAVKRTFGSIDGCDAALCVGGLEGMSPPSGCSSGVRVGSVHITLASGGALTLVNFHGSSGGSAEDRACRVDQIHQIFVDRGDGHPAADGTINLVMGDLNTDPTRLTASDESAAEWALYVGEGLPYQYISDAEEPSYQGLVSIDHIVSDVLRRGEGGCSIEPVWEGTYWDHLPVRCEVDGL